MYKLLYYYIKKYWYYECFPISFDLWAELDYFSRKYHIFRLLVMSYISYYELPIGKSLHRCILTYKYNNYCQISRVLLHWFYLFNPKQLNTPIAVRHCPILVKKTPLYHNVIKEFVLQGRNGTISRTMDTTNIFLFLAIFWTKFDCFTSKYHIFYLSSFATGKFLYTILWTTHMQNVILFHLLT